MQNQKNFYYNTAKFFLQNKQLSLLLVITTFVFGAIAFINTPKQYDPEITLPAFRITTDFPGASASEVENLVTSEIENKLVEIPGVDKINSYSFAGGRSIVMVTFKIGTDLDKSKTEVFEKISSNMDLAPLGVITPTIQQIDPENVPVMTIAITSKEISKEGLREFALDLKEKLKNIEGVTNIEISGGKKREFTVVLDNTKLAARKISNLSITQAIQANNFKLSNINLESEFGNIPLVVDGNIKNAEDLKRIVISGHSNSPIYLEDVAEIVDGYEVKENFITLDKKGEQKFNSENAVYLSFAKVKGSNITTVTNNAKKEIENLKENFIPENVNLEITRDEGKTAQNEIFTLTEHLFMAILIVTVTLYFFLGLRISFVVATAIPLTLALVFIAGYMFDMSINRITLFALIFSLGLLVDDAIVVVENIHRHFALKHSEKDEAIAVATGEVGMGVLLSTVTAVVVFAPMGLVTGMMGAYMGPIAFFAPVARLMSLFVAYTLSPYLSSVFLTDNTHDHEEKISWYEKYYEKTIVKILHDKKLQNKILLGTLGAVIIILSFPFFGFIQFRMLPKANKEQFYVYLDLKENSSLQQTQNIVQEIENKLFTIEEITQVEGFIGEKPVADFNGLFRGSNMRTLDNQATLKIDLSEKGERNTKSEEIVEEARKILTENFKERKYIKIKLVEDPPGPPVLSTFLTRIKGGTEEGRENIARDILAMLNNTKGVVDLDSTLPTETKVEYLEIDRSKLGQLGLSIGEVVQTLNIALQGQNISFAHLDQKERTNIFIRSDKNFRDNLSDLENIQIKNQAGEMISLGSIVTKKIAEKDTLIMHDKREAMTQVTTETEGRSVVYVTKDLIFKLLNYKLPSGNGELKSWNLFGMTFVDKETKEEYKIEWGGEFEMTLENFRDLGLAMLVAYLLIYIILVAQFKSFKSSLLIMSTIILGFAGVIPGFAILYFLFGSYFSATSMIGAIALGGIVVGNAILLLDFIEQKRTEGHAIETSIIESCKTRLKPIMLTAITAILGAVVIVADPVWSGLAWGLIFGLSISTLLTLIIFPILYYRFGK